MKKHMHLIHNADIRVATKWCFSEVHDDVALPEQKGMAPDQLIQLSAEMIRQQGYAEGYSQCQVRATLDAEQRIQDFMEQRGQEAARQIAELIQTLERQLQQAEQTLANGVVDLACEVARQVLRRELRLDPKALLPAIQDGMSCLLDESKTIGIRLNPQTLTELEKDLKQQTGLRSVKLVADSQLDLSDCRLECEGQVVDASLASRWHRVIAQLGLNSSWA